MSMVFFWFLCILQHELKKSFISVTLLSIVKSKWYLPWFWTKKRIYKNRFFRKEVRLLLTQAVKKNMVFAAWWTELEVLVQEILVWPVSHAFNMKDIIQHQRKSRENIGCCCFCTSYGGCKRQNLIFFHSIISSLVLCAFLCLHPSIASCINQQNNSLSLNSDIPSTQTFLK